MFSVLCETWWKEWLVEKYENAEEFLSHCNELTDGAAHRKE
jgi:hypothetical protein